MISGEAGIGKTAMLAALVSRAGPAPLVLRGFCWEGDGAPPYWPWSQVLRASGLPTAAGLGRRDRKLGDEAERARKTVSARVRDALAKIGPVDPELADHLRSSLRWEPCVPIRPPNPSPGR